MNRSLAAPGVERSIKELILVVAVFLGQVAHAAETRCHSSQVILYKDSSKIETLAARRNSDNSLTALGLSIENLTADSSAKVVKFPGTAAANGQADDSDSLVAYESAATLCKSIKGELKGSGYKCEPDCELEVFAQPSDPLYYSELLRKNYAGDQSAAISTAETERAWKIETGLGCTPPVVAVIDTGVNYLHPDLAANIWSNADEIPGNGIDDDGNGFIDDVNGWDFLNNDADPMDDNGHGTHVAGTVGAVGNNAQGVSGMMWKAQIMPLKFLGAKGGGFVSSAISAINYAAANGARVLNNSWGGGGYSAALAAAIESANAAGVLVVAAAGNYAMDNDKVGSYPANMSGAFSVAAVDKNGTLATFSNYGVKSVHLAAPGVSILSTLFEGYAWMSGTSMATPHVSGAAALAWCKKPELTLAELKTLLMSTGTPMPSLAKTIISGSTLNVGALLEAVAGDSLPPSEGSPGTGPGQSSPLSVFDPNTGLNELVAGSSFHIDAEPRVAGDLVLRAKVGKFNCRPARELSESTLDTTYQLAGRLPRQASAFGAIEFSISQGGVDGAVIASSGASISGKLSKKSARSQVKGICRSIIKSLKAR